MARVICHWTAGDYRPTSFDQEHYHFLVDGDGAVVPGRRTIADNVSTADGRYAAHTLNCNTGSIGIAVCAMQDAREQPFRPGPCPMLEHQFRRMAEVAAVLCRTYGIPVTTRTVLGHGEVQVNLGITQKEKWDPMVLPWQPSWPTHQVGTYLRTLVQSYLLGSQPAVETQVLAAVTYRGSQVGDARLINGSCYAPVDAVARRLGLAPPAADAEALEITTDSPVAIDSIDGRRLLDVVEVARAMGLEAEWNSDTQTLSLS